MSPSSAETSSPHSFTIFSSFQSKSKHFLVCSSSEVELVITAHFFNVLNECLDNECYFLGVKNLSELKVIQKRNKLFPKLSSFDVTRYSVEYTLCTANSGTGL